MVHLYPFISICIHGDYLVKTLIFHGYVIITRLGERGAENARMGFEAPAQAVWDASFECQHLARNAEILITLNKYRGFLK